MSRPRRLQAGAASDDLLPLFEYSNVINSSIDLRFILSTVLLTVMGKMLVSRGMVLLKREEDNFEIVAAKGLPGESVIVQIPKIPRTLVSLERPGKAAGSSLEFFAANGLRLLVPIAAHGTVVGLLSLGERLGNKKYSKSDQNLIKSLVNLSASAIDKALMLDQLKVANRSIDSKLQELNTLFELAKEFNLILDAQKVIRLLTFSLLGQVGVNRYAVCLRDGDSMKIVASRMEEVSELTPAIQALCELKNPFLTQDLVRHRKLSVPGEQLAKTAVRAVIPMQVQNRTKGLILLGDKLNGGEYTKADLEFLYSLGNLAIISIENAWLFKEAIEKQKLEDELKIARGIQQGLLPQRLPEIPGFDLAAINVSSKQVGGDYYDVVERSPNEYVIAIGDVSGKGTPAALLMANVQAALRALAPMNYTLPEATARINDLTCLNTGGDKFITFFWGVLDVGTHMFRYVNAGHNPPFLIKANATVERLHEGGLILGIMKTVAPYREGAAVLESGDTLFMFTDGVSEAMNAEEVDFTEERLEQIVKSVASRSAQEIIGKVRSEVEAYAAGAQQSDDITMLVVRVA